MKRLLLSAVALLCASVSAQTINPNQVRPSSTNGQVLTTVGGVSTWAPGGGGGGNINPAPQFRLFMQPNSGTASVAGPAVVGTNAVAPMLQGSINSDLYATGGGNNGISNALGSSDCGAGCFFARPQTSTDTESIASAMNGTSHTHGLDSQYGVSANYFYNAGLSSGNRRDADPTLCFFNDTLANPNVKTYCHSTVSVFGSAASYVGGSPAGTHGDFQELYAYGRAITSVSDINFNCFKVGDCQIRYDYMNYRGGSFQGGDQSVDGDAMQLSEADMPYGNIISGGPNATIIKSNFTVNPGNQGDGYALIATSELMASGLMTAQTNTSQLNSITTSDTHAVSNAFAVLSGPCGTSVARNAPVSTTCTITGLTGSFSAAANATVCVGDYAQPEQVSITATGSGTVTLGLTYSHTSGTPIEQGGLCGGKLALGYGFNSPFQSPHTNSTSYFVIGSRTSTSLDYVIVYNGGQNGNPPIFIPNQIPLTLGTLTRTGNVVTATNPGGQPFLYNNYVAPNASSIQVSGASPSDLNGTVTGTAANTAGVTWNQTGANETGSGGTLSVVGLNNYFVYCGAETVKVMGITINSLKEPVLDGTLQVEPNNCQWTPGGTIAQPNHYSTRVEAAHFTKVFGFTPTIAQPNSINNTIMDGQAWSGGIENNSQTDDPLHSFVGFGGSISGRTYLNSTNYYSQAFVFATPPLNGGNLFAIGCPAEGCVSTAYPYRLFSLSGAVGTSVFAFRPGNNTFTMNSGLDDGVYVAGRTAIGIGGTPGATGSPLVQPGTAGFGGYFTGVGDPSLSSSNDTLVFGIGNIGDSSGTLGAANLISPAVVAGVNTPPSGFYVQAFGTTGSTTYTYGCTAVTANGETPAGTASINNGNATLAGTVNAVKCYGVPGATSINIYRLAPIASQGLIGTEANSAENSGVHFTDTGIIANPAIMPPTVNTTGKLTVYGATTTKDLTVTGTCTGCGSGSALPSGTANQMLYYATSGTTVALLTLGTNLSITSGILNASSTAATNFNALTSGTNTAAAMTVGTGASLGATGSGTIAATSAPYSGLTGSVPTWNQNTTGTAANLSGTPALPNGTTATTQTVGDNTTKLATTAFVLANAGGIAGLTTGVVPKAATSSTIANSALDDGVTTANTLTYTGTGGISAKTFTATDTTHNTSVTGKQAAGGTDVPPTQTTGNSYLYYLAATGWNEADGTAAGAPLTRTIDFAAGTGISVAVSGKTVTFSATGSGIANTTTTVGTTAIAANTCSTAVTVTMTGVATTSIFNFTPNADISTVTGWGTTGGLTIIPWPTTNTLNYKVCNQTASSITPSASVTFNVGAR